MRYQAAGAQRASSSGRGTRTTTQPIAASVASSVLAHPHRPALRAAAISLLAALVAASLIILAPSGSRAGSAAAGMKAVIIVGPASSSTQEYLEQGEKIARQAENQGMDVRRVFTPRATWQRVKDNLQGANLVVYLGHGNGWPSPYGEFRPESKNGFGLNPCEEDCGTSGPTKYYGEQFLRKHVDLAPKAVVYLHRLCYASGNGEDGMAPVFDRDLATRRVSNFAAGFLDAGAGVVFALGWRQKLNLPEALARSDRSMDEIFKLKGTEGDYYDGFQGWDDYYRPSTRTDGARVHIDPHRRHGSLRAITGDLSLTAAEWRGEAPPPDEIAPRLKVRGAATSDASRSANADEMLTFAPNGDGIAERMLVRRTLSEPAFVDVEVQNGKAMAVRRFTRFGDMGTGETPWDGRDADGNIVRDGIYQVLLTPRDRAGNVGETRSVAVRVLTTLTQLRARIPAIHVSDGDGLAAATGLRSQLRHDATVRWEIRRGDVVVRTRYADEVVPAGPLAWRWDGTDDAGATVPDGSYVAVLAATTDVGTVRFEAPIRVGNWRISVDDRTPRARQQVRLIARSTEPLRRGVLRIDQAGHQLREVVMVRRDARTLVATFRVYRGGDGGRIGLTVVARDTGGQEEIGVTSVRRS